METRLCRGCGVSIDHKRKQAKWCSESCRTKQYRKPTPRTRGLCLTCNKEFLGPKNKNYCSETCYRANPEVKERKAERYREWVEANREAHNERMRDYFRRRKAETGVSNPYRKLKQVRCELCQEPFTTENARFCSSTCGNLHRAGWRNDTIDWEAFAEGKDSRRSYIPSAVRREVYSRDNLICQICFTPCEDRDPNIRYQPLAPSLDHIIPWSISQDDSIDNLRTAHLGCNIRRGAGAVA